MTKGETLDPYFEYRVGAVRQHRVVGRIELNPEDYGKVESNKDTLANPAIEYDIDEMGWGQKAVDNIIDACQKGWIRIERIGDDRVRMEFLPIAALPEEIGQVAEADKIKQNLSRRSAVYGNASPSALTYLQTVDFAVEGYMDDEQEGTRYGRIFVDSKKLSDKRDVYLDPESLHITDYEYGYSFCVKGGIPWEAIKRIDVIQARRAKWKSSGDETWEGSETKEEAEAEMIRQADRLRQYLDNLLA